MMIDLTQGDACIELKNHQNESYDSLITDPPAGISFMGKDWDKSDNFIENMTEIYKECLRVLKPGAHGLVWAIPRTSHWTALALEKAGFEVRDIITHIFGSGFPKSLDVSKAIDKMAGAEREVTHTKIKSDIRGSTVNGEWIGLNKPDKERIEISYTAPATPEAKQWEGWGTALKPASEHWILVRKPLGESTVAKNVLKHGTGGLNIDASRIAMQKGDTSSSLRPCRIRQDETDHKDAIFGSKNDSYKNDVLGASQGRFPANLVLSHNEDCEDECTENCAVQMLDKQSGDLTGQPRSENKIYGSASNTLGTPRYHKGDTGGASRFFYCAKASKKDRGEENTHPTVKSTKLMEYLIKLITPPHGTILDPFMGSGSTGVAAKRLGFDFVGIEKEKEYFEIAERRIG